VLTDQARSLPQILTLATTMGRRSSPSSSSSSSSSSSRPPKAPKAPPPFIKETRNGDRNS